MAGVSVASVWGFQQSRETFQLCTSMGSWATLLIVCSRVCNRGVEAANNHFMWLWDYHLHVWGMIRSLVLCNQARQCCVVQMATLQLEWAASVWEQSSDNCRLGRRLVIAVSVTSIDQWYSDWQPSAVISLWSLNLCDVISSDNSGHWPLHWSEESDRYLQCLNIRSSGLQ